MFLIGDIYHGQENIYTSEVALNKIDSRSILQSIAADDTDS